MTAQPELNSFDHLDTAIAELQANKSQFAKLDITGRLNLLERAAVGIAQVQEEWVRLSCNAKGIPLDSPTSGEEWLGGPVCMQRNIRLLRLALMDVGDYGVPKLPTSDAVRVAPNGQTVVQVFPTDGFEKLLYQGITGEIWMEPEVTPDNLRDTMAVAYRSDASQDGGVALVLGAGNVSSIGPMDVLYKLFVDNEVVILKMHPVNGYTGPLLEQAFASMIETGCLRIVYGGADVGDYLCKHDGVESIHITGSDKTHDIIVWGPPGPEQDERKKSGNPVNNKPVSSELGNVSPVVVVPGPWKPGDIAFQAANIATMVANNGSFNCNAAKIVVQQEGWEHRDALMDAVQSTLASLPKRKAYYPGADERYDVFMEKHPEAKATSERSEEALPWTVIRGVDSNQKDDICFTTEAFCSVVAETSLEADSPVEFLKKAVDFCNNDLWGTLSSTILIHPKSLKDPAMAAALEEAIQNLTYGTIAINHWGALGYGLTSTTWGAHSGHSLADIQSGRGAVHNTFLFDKPQKSVVRGPFRMFPKPPWFATNKRSHAVARRAAGFEANPSILKLPGLMFNALRG